MTNEQIILGNQISNELRKANRVVNSIEGTIKNEECFYLSVFNVLQSHEHLELAYIEGREAKQVLAPYLASLIAKRDQLQERFNKL